MEKPFYVIVQGKTLVTMGYMSEKQADRIWSEEITKENHTSCVVIRDGVVILDSNSV